MSFHFGFSKFGRQFDSVCWNTLHYQTSMSPLLLNSRKSTRLRSASAYYTITKFRAALILNHRDGPCLGFAGTSLGRPWGLSSRPRPSWIHQGETIYTRKEGAKNSALWHHAIPNYSPTSISTSQTYRVTISWATATTPTTDHDQRVYTTYFRF